MDIEGNELTDEHAKRVATGDISCTDNLPDLLKKCLPVSIAALKANWKKPIPQCWRKVWLNFPQHAKISQTNLKMPNCQIYRTLSSMPCRATSILIQLHTGHVSLNTFLKKIKALDSSPMQEMLPARDCSTLPQILQTIHRAVQPLLTHSRKGQPLYSLAAGRPQDHPHYPALYTIHSLL